MNFHKFTVILTVIAAIVAVFLVISFLFMLAFNVVADHYGFKSINVPVASAMLFILILAVGIVKGGK